MKNIHSWSVKTLLVIFITTIFFIDGTALANTVEIEPAFAGESLTSTLSSRLERKVFNLVNQERQRRNLKPLAFDSRLARVARAHSIEMADENYFSHYDRDGGTVVDRAKDFKIRRWRRIGENLFTCNGYKNPASIAVKGWLKSRSHRKNMLGRSWDSTGIGVAVSRDGEVYITQVFLKR